MKYRAFNRLATDANVKQAVTSWLQIMDTDFFSIRMQALLLQWDKCLNVYVDSMKV
jgi:hypothetical protein